MDGVSKYRVSFRHFAGTLDDIIPPVVEKDPDHFSVGDFYQYGSYLVADLVISHVDVLAMSENEAIESAFFSMFKNTNDYDYLRQPAITQKVR